MDLVEMFWRILEQAGYMVLNHRVGQLTAEELEAALEFLTTYGEQLPYVPAGSQTVRILKKERAWFFVYAHESSTERGFWGFSENIVNQIRGQEIINWVIVFLKETETEGWWAEPKNASQLIQQQNWNQNADGHYILNYPLGISGCIPFHSRQDLLSLLDDFGPRSVLIEPIQ